MSADGRAPTLSTSHRAMRRRTDCRTSEHEAFDAGAFREPGQPDAGEVVDLVRPPGVEMAERVVGQRRQMDNSIEATEVVDLESRTSMRRAGRSSGSGPSEQPSNRYESRPSTSWPASRSIGARIAPMYPSWPVTRTLISGRPGRVALVPQAFEQGGLARYPCTARRTSGGIPSVRRLWRDVRVGRAPTSSNHRRRCSR